MGEIMKKRMKKAIGAFAAALTGAFLLTGCGSAGTGSAGAAGAQGETAVETQTQTDSEVRPASEQAILVVSFGTSYNDSRDITIGAIENAIAEAFPDFEVRRSFTSQIIIDKLKERDGLEIDNVEEALKRAAADGIKRLVVQPTHLMEGYEYTDLKEALEGYYDKFEQVVLGEPLLTDASDYEAVAKAVVEATASYDDGRTAICFMGHGTEADSNSVYSKLQETLAADGYDNYFIGTVEAEPSLEDVIKAVDAADQYKKAVLQPLMVVAGDHANNDMAGDKEDSWKSAFEAKGYEVECILRGLGENEAIQEVYVEHTRAAVDSLVK